MPKAYMTVVFFDERFNVIQEGSIAKRVQQAGANAPNLVVTNQKAPKNGYCFVYVSNESDEMVYFDNLQVTQNHARIIEENHYYAYGLKIAAISSKKMADPAEGHVTNKDLYNDKELIDDADLNWYDYGFRSYDPQIGRFPQLDPLTDDYPELTPYQYASCEPIANIDIDGLEKGSAIAFSYDIGKSASQFSMIAPRVATSAANVGAKTAFTIGANLIVNGANTAAKIAHQKIGDQIINQVLEKGTILRPAVGGSLLFVFLMLSPDFDTWGKTRNEFPDSYYKTRFEQFKQLAQPKFKSPENENSKKPKTFYVTYTKTMVKPDGTTSVYSGRTSGVYTGDEPTDIDARAAVAVRQAGHTILNDEGYAPANVDRFSVNKAAIRGREQNLIDFNGGAQSEGGKSRNKIRGVGRHNRLKHIYNAAAIVEFGTLKNNNPADK